MGKIFDVIFAIAIIGFGILVAMWLTVVISHVKWLSDRSQNNYNTSASSCIEYDGAKNNNTSTSSYIDYDKAVKNNHVVLDDGSVATTNSVVNMGTFHSHQ